MASTRRHACTFSWKLDWSKPDLVTASIQLYSHHNTSHPPGEVVLSHVAAEDLGHQGLLLEVGLQDHPQLALWVHPARVTLLERIWTQT